MKRFAKLISSRTFLCVCLIVVMGAFSMAGCAPADSAETDERYMPGGDYGGGQWLVGVIHTHTSFSDGYDEPEVMLEYAKNEAGLDYYIITDHNYAEDTSTMGPEEFAELKERAFAKADELDLLIDVGEEVGAYSTTKNIKYPGYPTWFGEFLALNMTNFIDGAEREMEELLPQALADNPGMFAVVCHPFNAAEDCVWMSSWDIPGITHIEVWNAYEDGDYYTGDWRQAGELDDCDNPKAFMMWDYLNIRGLRLFGTTGSDTHDVNYLDTAYCVNYIGDKPATMGAVYDSFKTGCFYGSNGPRIAEFTVGGEMMGGEIEPGDVEIAISVDYNHPISSVKLYKSGYLLEEWNPDVPAFEITLEDTAEEWDFYRMTVECEDGDRPGFAYSNPVFVGE